MPRRKREAADDDDAWTPEATSKNRRRPGTGEPTGRFTLKAFDPNAPKRPAGAFSMFLSDRSEQFRKDNPNSSLVDVSRGLGIQWRALGDQEKQPYVERSKVERVRYERELEQYKKRDVYKQFEKELSARRKGVKIEPKSTERSTKKSVINRETDIPIFSEQFMKYTNECESALRDVRLSVGALSDEHASLQRRIRTLENSVSAAESTEHTANTKRQQLLDLQQKIKDQLIQSNLVSPSKKSRTNGDLSGLVTQLKKDFENSSENRMNQIRSVVSALNTS